MDPADLDEVPEPDKTQGLNLSPRLNFVPPPELPTPETASIEARAKALGIDALVWLAAFLPLTILYEASIYSVRMVERKAQAATADAKPEANPAE